MPYWITKKVWDDIVSRLSLSPSPTSREELAISNVVVPVTAVDNSFQGQITQPQFAAWAGSLVTAAGWFDCGVVVPTGKRWVLWAATTYATSGNSTFTLLAASDSGGTVYNLLYQTATPSSFQPYFLGQYPMVAAQKLIVYCDVHTTDANTRTVVMYTETAL